ncbi:hypothetical protein [Nesterenkonia populi]
MNATVVVWIVVALVIIFTAGTVSASGAVSRRQAEWVPYYEDKAGLPLPEELRGPVETRLRAQERWSRIGGLLGFAFGFIILALSGFPESTAPFVVIAAVLGMACGGGQAILAGQKGLLPDGPRYARLQSTTKADYVPLGQLLSARLAPAAAMVSAMLCLGVLVAAPFELPGDELPQRETLVAGVSLGFVVLLWPVVELTARHVLRRPQYAGSGLELAWDDHCRSEALRSLYGLVIGFGGLACFLAFAGVGIVVSSPEVREGAMDETLWVGSGMFLIMLLVGASFLVPVIVSQTRKPRQHVLRRLWADAEFTSELGPG